MAMKPDPTLPATLTPEESIRAILATALSVDEVRDEDLLDPHASIDVVEGVVRCERHLSITEVDEDRLLRCLTIGDLIRLCLRSVPA